MEIHRIEQLGARSVIHGKILKEGHPVYDTYVNHPLPVGEGRNPVRYVESPLDEARPCLCGCGELVTGVDFHHGHDQTALHDRVKQIGTVADFLVWFDIVRGNRPLPA